MKRLVLTVIWTSAVYLLSISQTPSPPASPPPLPRSGYMVGDTAEDFRLRNVDNRWFSLADFGNVNGYIVIFTCNHCPYAQAYEQRIIELHNRFSPRGFPVIAINPNNPEIVPEDSFEEMQVRAREKSYPFVYLFDAQQDVGRKFWPTRTPTVYLLDKNRIVRYIGAIDDNAEAPSAVRRPYVVNAIDSLMRGEDPNPDFTRTLGCTVKRR